MKKIFFTTVLLFCVLQAGQSLADSPWQFSMILQAREKNPLSFPTGIHFDADKERVYVAESGKDRILAYSRFGEFLRDFDADDQLLGPFDLVRDEKFIWIVEKGKNSLTKIDIEGRRVLPNSLFDNDRLLYPDRLEKEGDILYVLDKASGTVFALDEQLAIKNRFACKECDSGFVDFKIRDKRLWALEQESRTVYEFSLDGVQQAQVALDRDVLDFPRSLEVDDAGFFYVLDRHRGIIAVFDRGGTCRYSFMGPGRARQQLYYPVELKFDPWGRLFVVEEGNGRIQVFERK